MATSRKTTSEVVDATPTADVNWSDAEVLSGLMLIDKMELLNVPFMITGVKVTVNDRDVVMVWVEGQRRDSTRFTFVDSSTGVKAQLDDYLASKGLGGTLDEWIDVRLVSPQGLRVSKYTTKDERGKDREARTFYLTTNGQRV